jgi:hypothetical protein
MNDPEKEVRDELRRIFWNKEKIVGTEYAAFVKAYIKSKAFADDPDYFVWSLKDLAGTAVILRTHRFFPGGPRSLRENTSWEPKRRGWQNHHLFQSGKRAFRKRLQSPCH